LAGAWFGVSLILHSPLKEGFPPVLLGLVIILKTLLAIFVR
jgi:hypothetical protein